MLCLLGTTDTGTNIDLDILNTNNQPPVHIPAHRCYDQAVTRREACGGKEEKTWHTYLEYENGAYLKEK